jgi:hypothetical protein
VLTGPNGVIDMQNETKALHWFSTYSRLQCEWNVTVRAGRTIAVEFHVFNLPSVDTAHCAESYIIVSDGLRATYSTFSMEPLCPCSIFVSSQEITCPRVLPTAILNFVTYFSDLYIYNVRTVVFIIMLIGVHSQTQHIIVDISHYIGDIFRLIV